MKKIIAFAALLAVINLIFPQYSVKAELGDISPTIKAQQLNAVENTIHGNTLLALSAPSLRKMKPVRELGLIVITAYSSTPDQTDASPFITAKGTRVREGIIAANFLPFGTKVRFPELFGNKVFVVEDRMARKNNHKMDIWFPNRTQALAFGVKYSQVEVLEI